MGNQVLVAIKDSEIEAIKSEGHKAFYDALNLRMNESRPVYQNGMFISEYCHASDNVLHIVDGSFGVRHTDSFLTFHEVYDLEKRQIREDERNLKAFNKTLRSIRECSIRKTGRNIKSFDADGEMYHLIGILTDSMHRLEDDSSGFDYIMGVIQKEIDEDDIHFHMNGVQYIGSYHHNEAVAVLMTGNCFLPILKFTTENGMKLSAWNEIADELKDKINKPYLNLPYAYLRALSKEATEILLSSYGYKATYKEDKSAA